MEMLLANYTILVARVDEFCSRTAERHAGHIACKAGCDECCRHLTLFPVEAAKLALALRQSPGPVAALLRRNAAEADRDGRCPLLVDGLCALYEARPIICRTHGLPLAVREDGAERIDYCPRNFEGLESIPGTDVLRLDRLNEALVMVDAQFVAALCGTRKGLPARISIADALLLDPATLAGRLMHRPLDPDPSRQ